ncbi:heat shock factor protein 5-like [Corvus hawaiiensis]|uniref:heat shock factor protein 5-like n=1 Tax=Corvus hawaiiensis TaxID=134902 RepID=UPI00201972C2|nr:heat shock factor protein 5-like [Corvus hawaiiensis]
MKLWLLVNSPCVHSVRWDARGEGLLIDQGLFEQEVLGVGLVSAGEEELFKTKNFGSIVRQFNLYGFHKLTASPASSAAGSRPTAGGDTSYAHGPLHHFWNPDFRYHRPDLLVKIKRLTKANKEKLDAGLEVTSRLPDDFQHITGRGLAAAAHVPRRSRKDRTFPVAKLMCGHVFPLEKRDGVSWMSNKTERQGRPGGACQACKGRSRDIPAYHTVKEQKQNSLLDVCNRQGFLV